MTKPAPFTRDSSWEGRLLTSTGSDETRRRILNNARAAEWERLLNQATRTWPGLTGEALSIKAAELQREKLSAAGKKGRDLQRQRLEEADRIRAMIPEIEDRLLETLDYLRASLATEEAA